MYFVTGLNYVLQQPSNAGKDKTKADIPKELLFLLILLAVCDTDIVKSYGENTLGLTYF